MSLARHRIQDSMLCRTQHIWKRLFLILWCLSAQECVIKFSQLIDLNAVEKFILLPLITQLFWAITFKMFACSLFVCVVVSVFIDFFSIICCSHTVCSFEITDITYGMSHEKISSFYTFLLQRKFTFTVNMHLINNQVFDVYILTLTYKTYNIILGRLLCLWNIL